MLRFVLLSLFSIALVAPACSSKQLTDISTDDENVLDDNATGTISGSVSGTITNGQVLLATATGGSSTFPLQVSLLIAAAYDPPGGQLSISAPSGVSDASIVSTIGFDSVPVAGTYTQADQGVCGGVAVNYFVGSAATAFEATSARDCSTQAVTNAYGTWTLVLTNVATTATAPLSGSSVGYYAATGTFDAVLTSGATLHIGF